MKLLILSDSHRKLEAMCLAVRLERPDAVIHLGDHDADAVQLRETFPELLIYSLSGNCDRYCPVGTDTLCCSFEGVRIFAAHGHEHGVKGSLLRFAMAAAEKNARLALFGHTHVPYCQEYNGIWLLNPGSCGCVGPTYGLVHIENGTLRCELKQL